MTDTLLNSMERINAAAVTLYDHLNSKEDTLVTETLLRNMERINTIAEILYDILCDNPRAQVLTEVIIEASQTNQQ